MIHKHRIGGNTRLDGIILHGVDFVVILPPVVTAHEQAVGCAGFVGVDPCDEPVFEDAAWVSVVPNARAEHKDCVRVQRGGLIRRDDPILDRNAHSCIHGDG